MNILIIGPIPKQYGGKELGGIATHIYGFINEALNNNLKISIWYHKGVVRKCSLPQGLEIINNKLLFFIKMFSFLPLFFSSKINFLDYKSRLILCYQYVCLRDHLKKKKIDIIHIHSLQNTSTLALKLLKGKYSKIPVVITDHGFWQSNVKNKRLKLLKSNCNYAKKVIYISDFAYKYHKKYKFSEEEKLKKIHNPIIFERPNYVKVKNKTKVLFFNGLSESVKRKGFVELIEAINCSSYLHKNVKLIAIVNEHGEKYINKIDTKFKYELFPKLDWVEIRQIYLQSDVMVLPSKSESFGLVYIEALMFGIPIVGFNGVFDEFSTVFKENYIGESYSPKVDSIEDLAIQIEKALNTPFDKERVIDVVENQYSWHYKINDFIQLYQSVLNTSS